MFPRDDGEFPLGLLLTPWLRFDVGFASMPTETALQESDKGHRPHTNDSPAGRSTPRVKDRKAEQPFLFVPLVDALDASPSE